MFDFWQKLGNALMVVIGVVIAMQLGILMIRLIGKMIAHVRAETFNCYLLSASVPANGKFSVGRKGTT